MSKRPTFDDLQRERARRAGRLEQVREPKMQRKLTERELLHMGMRHTFRTFAMEAGVDVGITMILMNHRPAGVTWRYVTRANLLGPMRDTIETIAGKIVSCRGA